MPDFGPISVILFCVLVAFTLLVEQAIHAVQAWWYRRKRDREALPKWGGR